MIKQFLNICFSVLLLHASQGECASDLPFGVWWFAPFYSGGGYSSEAVAMVKALSQASLEAPPTRVINKNTYKPPPFAPAMPLRISQHGDAYSRDFFDGLDLESRQVLYKLTNTELPDVPLIVICHSEPGAWAPALYSTTPCPAPPPSPAPLHLVGRTTFETDRITAEHVARCNRMDEVWVPSEFNRRTFMASGVDPKKLHIVHEPVDVKFFDPARVEPIDLPIGKSVFNSGPSRANFSFLSVFKWEHRKGWDILLRAFLSEFSAGDDVALYLLTNAYHSKRSFQRQIKALAEDLGVSDNQPRIYVVGNHLPTTDLPRLYKAVNAFVLPSRGEGWGRPHVEAMSMGLPIIATNWSGPTEYMTVHNSYPLQYEGLEEIQEGAFKGHKWASPSVPHLRELMRHLTIHKDESRQRGIQARQDMINRFSPSRITSVLVESFERIAQERKLTKSKRTTIREEL